MTEKAKAEGKDTLSGEDAFKLYDTFGFPIDLTREIAKEAGLSLDEEAFKALMNEQRQRARAARADISGWAESSADILAGIPQTEFVGYDTLECEAKVLAIIADGISVESANEGDVTVITDKTPFYGEGGGQIGDIGYLLSDNVSLPVSDTKKSGGVFLHLCTFAENATLSVGDTVNMKASSVRREQIAKNHSACHLLQAALRQVLGSHVEQAGSYVSAQRVRFDFSHYAPLTEEELREVEYLVNRQIFNSLEVCTVETDIESAKKEGAMALFGEKYGKTVRMVKMGDFSTELCGGTHVKNTAQVGIFKIISESSVAAGIRRIEGTTALGVLQLLTEKEHLIEDTAKELKVQNTADIAKKAASLQAELRSANSENEALKAKIAAEKLSSITANKEELCGIHLVLATVTDTAPDAVRNVCDNLRTDDPLSVALIAVVNGGKMNLIASCGKDAQAKGMHAGNIAKTAATICGGGGGGRPDSAMAGGKNPEKISEALAAVRAFVEANIK